jgi:hypothetical protein
METANIAALHVAHHPRYLDGEDDEQQVGI